ncbi:hypothetical protein GCM10027418_19730 [Mariniluteicoccus endophyticus]
MRIVRMALVPLLALAPLALTGCGGANYKCSGNNCTVTFTKPGSSVQVGKKTKSYRANGKRRTRTTDQGVRMQLIAAEANQARISVGGTPLTCRAGQTVTAPRATLTCTEVSAQKVVARAVVR